MKKVNLTPQAATAERLAPYGLFMPAAKAQPTQREEAYDHYENLTSLNLSTYEMGFVHITAADPHEHRLIRYKSTRKVMLAVGATLYITVAKDDATNPGDYSVFALPPGSKVIFNTNIWHGIPKSKDIGAGAILIYTVSEAAADKETLTPANHDLEIVIDW